jgi:hypothetical protein
MSNAALKHKRVEAGISRKVAADACGISQFRLDRIERGVVTDAEAVKTYSTGLEQLLKSTTLAPHKPAPPKAEDGGGRTKPAGKPAAKKATTTKPTTKPTAAKKTTTPAVPKPEADKS